VLWFALLWGGGVSILAAAVFNQLGADYFFGVTADADLAFQLTASFVAPVVEETAKGVGVLLIFLARRRYFDGPVDGVVYAATVAAGFAFVENVLYFGQADEGLATVFVMRAVAAPFAHVLFTACIGLALGVASRRRSGLAAVVAFPLGLAAAVSLHALWNISTTLGTTFLAVYVLIQVPLFLIAIGLAVWLGRRESDVVRLRLSEYAASGWFLPAEVEMLSSLPLRRRAAEWAGRYGPHAREAMRAFQKHATSLAFHRQRALTGRAELGRRADEAELLAALGRDRAAFAAARVGG
jgi:RsiW-degrading membrane proteinase PrsW (M82 family)